MSIALRGPWWESANSEMNAFAFLRNDQAANRIGSRPRWSKPNVTHDGEARLTPKFWLARGVDRLVATGLSRPFNVDSSPSVNALDSLPLRVPPERRGRVQLDSRIVGPVDWWVIGACRGFDQAFIKHEKSDIDDAVWNGEGESFRCAEFLTSIVSEIVIGLGGDRTRRGTKLGGALGSVLSPLVQIGPPEAPARRLWRRRGTRLRVQRATRRAIFTAEVSTGSFALPS